MPGPAGPVGPAGPRGEPGDMVSRSQAEFKVVLFDWSLTILPQGPTLLSQTWPSTETCLLDPSVLPMTLIFTDENWSSCVWLGFVIVCQFTTFVLLWITFRCSDDGRKKYWFSVFINPFVTLNITFMSFFHCFPFIKFGVEVSKYTEIELETLIGPTKGYWFNIRLK